jgi:hypothetical protein
MVDAQLARLRLPVAFFAGGQTITAWCAGPDNMECASSATDVAYPPSISGSSPSATLTRKVARAGRGDVGHSSDEEDALAGPRTEEERPVYILSYTRKRLFATLHLVTNGCYRRPKYELKYYSYFTELEARNDAKRCRDCWPPAKLPDAMTHTVDIGVDKLDSGSVSSSSADCEFVVDRCGTLTFDSCGERYIVFFCCMEKPVPFQDRFGSISSDMLEGLVACGSRIQDLFRTREATWFGPFGIASKLSWMRANSAPRQVRLGRSPQIIFHAIRA